MVNQLDDVVGNMIEEDQPDRQPAKQIEIEVAGAALRTTARNRRPRTTGDSTTEALKRGACLVPL